MFKRILSAIFVVFVCFSFAGCSGNDEDGIVGTWVVSEYSDGENVISTDEIGDIYGETTYEFNKYSLIFTKSGNLKIIKPDFQGGTIETSCSYTVQDGYVEVVDPDNSTNFELVEYNNGKIFFEVTTGLIATLTKE